VDHACDRNGSGVVRIQIIIQHPRADWVEFIDNHVTLSPHFVEMLMREIHKDSELEILYL